jgi:hypothetical protein
MQHPFGSIVFRKKRIMKNTILFAVLALSSFAAIAQDGKVIDDKNAQKRSAQGFHGIEISSGIDLYLSQGNEEAVAVSASDLDVRDRIRVEVTDGILRIYMEDHGFHWGHWGNQHLKAYVSCKTMDLLHASGGSDVYMEDVIHSDHLKMNLSGGSDLHGKLTIGELSVTQSGGSDSYVSGTATTLIAYLTVNKELTASASGGSDVHYKGNGVVRSSSASGSGSISHRD